MKILLIIACAITCAIPHSTFTNDIHNSSRHTKQWWNFSRKTLVEKIHAVEKESDTIERQIQKKQQKIKRIMAYKKVTDSNRKELLALALKLKNSSDWHLAMQGDVYQAEAQELQQRYNKLVLKEQTTLESLVKLQEQRKHTANQGLTAIDVHAAKHGQVTTKAQEKLRDKYRKESVVRQQAQQQSCSAQCGAYFSRLFSCS